MTSQPRRLEGFSETMLNKNASSPDDPDHHFAPPPAPSDTDYHHARWPTLDSPKSKAQSPKSNNPQVIQNRGALWATKIQNIDVLVVGVCSSGKSTLVRKLQEAGYD